MLRYSPRFGVADFATEELSTDILIHLHVTGGVTNEFVLEFYFILSTMRVQNLAA